MCRRYQIKFDFDLNLSSVLSSLRTLLADLPLSWDFNRCISLLVSLLATVCFILIPLSTNLEDSETIREKYFKIVLDRIKKISGNDIEKHIIYKRSFCVSDFKETYNSFGGNAYGLANTLMQTAFLRPKLQSKKVKKLYFSGQLTVPGPGVPPAIVSGKLVSDIIINNERTFW